MKSLGTKLKELRLGRGMSQQMLANKINVSDKLISKWETNNAVPALDYLKMYCEIFDVSIEYLTSDYNGDKNMKHCENVVAL